MAQITDDQKVISKWHDRIKRGFLWIIILRLYDQKNPLSGTDIKAKINEIHQHWDPSPGSIYPILKDLEKDGLIEEIEHENMKNRRYIITDLGSLLLTTLRNDVFAFRMQPIEFLRRMGKNEDEFKKKFGSMVDNISPDEVDEVKDLFKNILSWFEDLFNESRSKKNNSEKNLPSS